jgi:tetratricopeptide (TPR) repeat protein
MTDAEVAVARARQLVTVKRYAEAKAALGSALAEASTAGEAFCLLAQCELELGRPTLTIDAARRALAAGQAGEWPHRLIAVGHLRLGETRPALRAAQEAARQEPNNDHALHILAVALLCRRWRRRHALAIAEHNVSINPHSSLAFHTLGRCLAATRRLNQAEDAYRTALRLDPDDVDVALDLAHVLRRMRRHEEAGQVYLAAGAMNPADDRVRHGLLRLGLPVVAASMLLKVFLGIQFVRLAFTSLHSIRAVAILWFVAMALGAVVTTWLRIRGGRALPAHIRDGLRADYRNAALVWVLVTGEGAVLLGLAALVRVLSTGDPTLGVLLIAVGTGLILICRRLYIGPGLSFGDFLLWPLRRIAGREA